MKLLDRIFGKAREITSKEGNSSTEAEVEQRNNDFIIKLEQLKILFAECLSFYNTDNCQCAYPRFQQIIGIDCTGTNNLFKCYDTELLIDLSSSYFHIENSELNDECSNKKWTCKKCSSIYEYGWSDFSIHVERQKLKLITLNVDEKGKPTIEPIPLYFGLIGHSYPSKSEITSVDFENFKHYMTEK